MSDIDPLRRVRDLFAEHPEDVYDRDAIVKSTRIGHQKINYYLTQLVDDRSIERLARGKYRHLGAPVAEAVAAPVTAPATPAANVSRSPYPKPGAQRRGATRADPKPHKPEELKPTKVSELTTRPAKNGRATLTVAPADAATFPTVLSSKSIDEQAAKIGEAVGVAVANGVRVDRPSLVTIEEPSLDDVRLATSFRERIEANPEIFTAIDRAWYDKLVTAYFQAAPA